MRVTEELHVSAAAAFRLSLYHSYLSESIQRGGGHTHVTAHAIGEAFDVQENTVRRDLALVGAHGRPGHGYETMTLFAQIQEFLGLSDHYPVIEVGSAQTIQALRTIFPPHTYGIDSVGCFSEVPEDAGTVVSGVEIQHISALPDLDPSLGVSVALVACSPGWVQTTLEMLSAAGIKGVLLLTPKVKLDVPTGMTITHVRMLCDMKLLAWRCRVEEQS